jgi:hypothetical protein
VSDFGKNVMLEVKKDKETNVVPKKLGRDSIKEKGASKLTKTSKTTAPKALVKKGSAEEKIKDRR